MSEFFLNTIVLGGSTQDKINAASRAGFSQIELWREDVEDYPAGVENLVKKLASAKLKLTDIQVLRDFDGAPGSKRDVRRKDAIKIMDLASELGAKVISVPATTDPDFDKSRIIEDLRWLAENARLKGLNIAYEPMSWSVQNNNLQSAWQTIQEVSEPNIQLVVDAFHIFSINRTARDLSGIPPESIASVQLCDLKEPVGNDDLSYIGRHYRQLPGFGYFPILSLMDELGNIGYTGPIGIEVFSDKLKKQDPIYVAEKAMESLEKIMKSLT